MKFGKSVFITALAAIFILSSNSFARTASDFTATDTKGVQHHLYSYLNAGKYVLIEFGYLG